MNVCRDKRLLLHGLLDGELDAAHSLKCEAHLRECAGCAAEFARLRALWAQLRAPGVSFQAPPALRARIEAAAMTARARMGIRGRKKAWKSLAPKAALGRQRGVSWGWAASVTALAAALALILFVHFPRTGIADELVADHVRSLLAGHLVDVAASDQHVIRPWFTGKVDFSPPVFELTQQGFPLVGGRLDYMPGRVVTAVVYRRGQHIINVFAWPAGTRAAAPTTTTKRDGYNVLGWSQSGLRFCAVSDVTAAELWQLRAAIAEASSQL